MIGRVPAAYRMRVADVDAPQQVKSLCAMWATKYPNYKWDSPAIDKRGKGLLIGGDPAVARRLACAVAWQCWLDHYAEAYYFTIENLIDIKKITWNKDQHAEGDREVAERVLKDSFGANLLVVDGLGREQASEWTRVNLPSLLDNRQSAGKPTIVTTQLTVEALQGQYTGHMVFDTGFLRIGMKTAKPKG